MPSQSPSYHGYRFPSEIISHAVWLYHRFALSFRDVEDLLAQRSITVTYETIRQWGLTFGPSYARALRRRRGRLGDTWHLDELFVTLTASLSRRGARSGARDRTIRKVKALGRRRWKKASGYHQHARVENAFFRYTSIVGDCLRARSSSGQRREAVLACNVLNRMTELGRPVSYRIGR